jgi:hypothetical protein
MELRARPLLPVYVVAALWATLLLRIARLWPALPPVMATHFGPGGQPDGYMSRGSFLLFTLLVEGGATLLVLSSPLWMRRMPPSLINMPNRAYWLAEPRRAQTLRRLGTWMAWLAVALAGLMVGANELLLRANATTPPSALDMGAFLPLMGGFLAFTLAWTVGLYLAFRLPAEARG